MSWSAGPRGLEAPGCRRPGRHQCRGSKEPGATSTDRAEREPVRLQVLGPVRMWRYGVETDIGPAGRRALLAVLALARGRAVSRAELVDALWGERPPRSVVNVIHTYVMHLRRLLEPDRPRRMPSAVLTSVGDGYALRLPPGAVDLDRFLELTGAAMAASTDGDQRRAAGLLTRALALWAGTPAADLPQLAGHGRVLALSRERHEAVSAYADCMIAIGRADDALPLLEEAARLSPLDEATHTLLIRAYQRAGRRADAAAAYQALETRLADDLGVEPGPALRALRDGMRPGTRLSPAPHRLEPAAAARGISVADRLPVAAGLGSAAARAFVAAAGAAGQARDGIRSYAGRGAAGPPGLGAAGGVAAGGVAAGGVAGSGVAGGAAGPGRAGGAYGGPDAAGSGGLRGSGGPGADGLGAGAAAGAGADVSAPGGRVAPGADGAGVAGAGAGGAGGGGAGACGVGVAGAHAADQVGAGGRDVGVDAVAVVDGGARVEPVDAAAAPGAWAVAGAVVGHPVPTPETVGALGGPAPRGWVVPAELPPGCRAFVGRAAELARLDGLLAETRPAAAGTVPIVLVGGPAGVGKTALAVQWAHRVADAFPDGHLYVDLRGFDPVAEPVAAADALRGFLEALGHPAERMPTDPQARAGVYRSLLAGRRLLVVLDNARDVEQVRPLLPGTPGCLVLVTSRSRLAGLVAAEGAYPLSLDLLPDADARELLSRRIGADRLAAEPHAAGEVVEACGRLPLALAIVAARAAVRPELSLAAVAEDLDDPAGRLDLLSTGESGIDLRAAYAGSYRALGPAAARLFRLLGLYPSTEITAAAAASLAGLGVPAVRVALAELTGAHLLAERRRSRYALPELLRLYAAELAGDEPADSQWSARLRVLDYYLRTARAAAGVLNGAPARWRPDAAAPFVDARSAALWFAAEEQTVRAVIAFAQSYALPRYAEELARLLGDCGQAAA
jgi:DNA-binding SARP family transcriptional activator